MVGFVWSGLLGISRKPTDLGWGNLAMVFRIPEERKFCLVVEGLYDERTNRTLPFSLEIDFKVLDRYSFSRDYPYLDYSVSFRVIGRTEHFIPMSYDHYDPFENTWQFSYCNIFKSKIESFDTIYDLFVQIAWVEEKEENNQYIPVSVVYVWVDFQDPNGDIGVFL